MGQVLGFAHCKEAPSTASTTPDSTEGGNEEFLELPVTPEPPEEEEEEEEDEDGAMVGDTRGDGARDHPPRELTFSYIAFRGGGGSVNEPGPRCRRDSRRGRPPRLNSGPPRGPDPRSVVRPPPPQKKPEELPNPEPPRDWQVEVGGGLPELGGPEDEETSMSLASEPPEPSRDAGPPPTPLPGPPPVVPPPEPPDQSPKAPGVDALAWELLYWRDPGRSALALLGALGAVGCVARFSIVSVGAYGALAVLGVTVPLRLLRGTLRLLRPHGHPARAQPEGSVGLSPEEQQLWARRLARHLGAATRTLTRLFLVHSVPESLKFAFLFYLLTYVGAACNGLTLLGAGVICAFTFPVLYRHHQTQIDQYLSLGRNQLSHLRDRIQAKLPSAKAKLQ